MATEGPDQVAATVEATAERVRELNERILELSSTAGHAYLDIYERSLMNMADLYERAATTTPFGDWSAAIARAQAEFTRELTEAYTAAGHEVLATTQQAAPGGAAAGAEPWPGYDDETVDEVTKRLADADDELRARVREYERRNKNRSSVLAVAQRG